MSKRENVTNFNEDVVEQAALEWLQELDYSYSHGSTLPRINPLTGAEDYSQVVLEDELRSALARINPKIPSEAIDDAFRKATRSAAPEMIEDNRLFHRLLVDGVDVEYTRPDGSIAGDKVWLVDFDNPKSNSFMAVNQFTIIENKHNRRPAITPRPGHMRQPAGQFFRVIELLAIYLLVHPLMCAMAEYARQPAGDDE
jgi:type I restriction enzyme R subunit